MFSRLYAYRERPSVSPLENFLTEAFAEFFGRLPLVLKRSLLMSLLPPAAEEIFTRVFLDLPRLAIRTQASAVSAGSTKRPDLVIYADDRDLVVIEAKVGAGLQQHGAEKTADAADEARATRNQLETYARWISAGNDRNDAWRGAVVFLTTYTEPPDDFVDGRDDGVFRSKRRWGDVGDWILDEVAISDLDVTHCAIAAEFHQFLTEQNLMTKYITARDIAAASLFAKSNAIFYETFMAVLKAMGSHAPKLRGKRQYNADFWSEGNLYWGWFHFARTIKRTSSKPYVAIGICFEVPEVYAADAAKLPKHEPFFFVSCVDDWETEKTSTFLTALPAGWSEIDDGWVAITTKLVREFSGDPDERVEQLKAWSIEHVDKLVACIPDYAEAAIDTASLEPEDEKEDA